MKTDKDWIEEHDRLITLFDRAREELKKYPGVVAVEIGIKETGRNLTDDLSFRVYVQKKKEKQDLTPAEVIPGRIFGVKTDVIEQDIPVLTYDDKKYRPLKGGIQLANEEDSGGTLGCIARSNSDNSIVVLSNSHVLMGGGVSVPNIEVGQPKIAGCCCCTCDEIGNVIKTKLDGMVDCAIARLKPGVSGLNVIRGLNDDGADGMLNGSAVAVVHATNKVKKVGRTSDKTEGVVVSITHPTPPVSSTNTPARANQILIKPNAGFTRFQDDGDSGAALVDKDNKVIGLMWGAYSNPSSALYGHGIACPIGAVLSEMDITIISGSLTTSLAYANAPDIGATETISPESAQSPEGASLMDLLQARLSQTGRGRLLLDLFNRHKDEVLSLVNHNRAGAVVWRRKQGPAFLAAMGRSAKTPVYRIPDEIEGVNRRHALMSMINILEEYGSQSLKAAIDRHSLTLLQIFSRYDTVHEMIDELEEAAPREIEEKYEEHEDFFCSFFVFFVSSWLIF